MKTHWTAYVEQDGDDVILPLPTDLLDQLGWKDGDVLVWDIDNTTGAVTLTKRLVWWRRFIRYVKGWRDGRRK